MRLSLYFINHPADSRPPMLFLHGFMGNAGDWYSVIQPLEAAYRCILADLPGHRISTKDLAPDWQEVEIPLPSGTMSEIADALETFRKNVLHVPWQVAGYSMGGRVALFMACHFPTSLQRLVLISASPGLKTVAERKERQTQDEALALQLEQLALLEEDKRAFALREYLHQWYRTPIWASLHARPDILEAIISNKRQGLPAGWALSLRTIGTGMQPSLWPVLNQLALPVCLITGDYDPKFTTLNQEMAQHIHHTQHHIVPNAGHALLSEAPMELAHLILQGSRPS
ncbi:MAG: alpha/beta fold hydrolase [Bacteroidetes Order II. Incertae sedis bacterium]|nr:alpha/beta fold hydrolase [Bacteroidetes Order II. bacterium]